MSEKIKFKVRLIPLDFTPGFKHAREREIDVEIYDTGNTSCNYQTARKQACIELDCNSLNYAFGVSNLSFKGVKNGG